MGTLYAVAGIILGAFKNVQCLQRFCWEKNLKEPQQTKRWGHTIHTFNVNQLQPSTEASYGPVKQVLNAAICLRKKKVSLLCGTQGSSVRCNCCIWCAMFVFRNHPWSACTGEYWCSSSLWTLGAPFLFEFMYRKLIHTGPFYWMLWKTGQSSFSEGSQGITRWFQNVSNVFGIFIPGEMIPFWRAYFSDGLKPPRMSASLWFTLFSWLLKERRSGRAWRWLEKTQE